MSTYAGGRRILDVDAHLMEQPGWLEAHVESVARDHVPPVDGGDGEFAALLAEGRARHGERHRDEREAELSRTELLTMPRKGWLSLGGSDPAERSIALDELGFEAQLVFPTASFAQVAATPVDHRLAAVRGMNRGLLEFCAADTRLLAVNYVPFGMGPDIAVELVHEAARAGAGAVMVDTIPARDDRSPTHPVFDPVWSAITDADLACMLHVGLDNGWRPVPRQFFDNGRSLPHFRSDAPGDALSFSTVGAPAAVLLAALVYDGVLTRHPALRIGVTELGGTWVPGFLRHLDTSFKAFRRLQDLSHLESSPSDYVRRHVWVSPFAGEPVGWMMEQAGAELFVFSSDFPHHEGSDDPIGRFERTMDGADATDRQRFYWDGPAELLGTHLP